MLFQLFDLTGHIYAMCSNSARTRFTSGFVLITTVIRDIISILWFPCLHTFLVKPAIAIT